MGQCLRIPAADEVNEMEEIECAPTDWISNAEERSEFLILVHHVVRERIYSLLDYISLVELCIELGLRVPYLVNRKIVQRHQLIQKDLCNLGIGPQHWIRLHLRMKFVQFRNCMAAGRNDPAIMPQHQLYRSLEDVD